MARTAITKMMKPNRTVAKRKTEDDEWKKLWRKRWRRQQEDKTTTTTNMIKTRKEEVEEKKNETMPKQVAHIWNRKWNSRNRTKWNGTEIRINMCSYIDFFVQKCVVVFSVPSPIFSFWFFASHKVEWDTILLGYLSVVQLQWWPSRDDTVHCVNAIYSHFFLRLRRLFFFVFLFHRTYVVVYILFSTI